MGRGGQGTKWRNIAPLCTLGWVGVLGTNQLVPRGTKWFFLFDGWVPIVDSPVLSGYKAVRHSAVALALVYI